MTNIISDSYASLVETLKKMKSLKLRDHLGDNVADFFDAILVYADRLDIYGSFNTNHLSYIIRIFEDTSDSRFYLWVTHKYKDVMKFIKRFPVRDEDVMQPDDIITYDSLVQDY